RPHKRMKTSPIMEAIQAAGLAEKAIKEDKYYLSELSNTELISVLGYVGFEAAGDDEFEILSQTANELWKSPSQEIHNLEFISSPNGRELPVIRMKDLFVRQDFKSIYDIILDKCNEPKRTTDTQLIVEGTAGIGKSSFLVYLAIRILATSDIADPPIIFFQRKEDSRCYVFGGLGTVRFGDITDFEPFLAQPNVWLLVDSTPKPILFKARTVFSLSPRTIASDAYQDIDKRVTLRYNMNPWSLEELEKCKNQINAFEVIPPTLFEKLYARIGGIPRYVLEMPRKELWNISTDEEQRKIDIERAWTAATLRIDKAIDNLKEPSMLLRYFAKGKDTLENSSRILHRWSVSEDFRVYELRWASNIILHDIVERTKDIVWSKLLKNMTRSNETKGSVFELYAQSILWKGNCTLHATRLGGTHPATNITLPEDNEPVFFDKIEENPPQDSLWIPNTPNFACTDIDAKFVVLAPSDRVGDFGKLEFTQKGSNAKFPNPILSVRTVKQYIVGVDIESASNGGDPFVNSDLTLTETTNSADVTVASQQEHQQGMLDQ
ncbi:hypothetical protein BGZ49_008727, partial [Haplosporangium sp. Z 27]